MFRLTALQFKDENFVRAVLKNSNGEELMQFEGKCGGTIHRVKPDKALLVDVQCTRLLPPSRT
jgi:hypothetical protein